MKLEIRYVADAKRFVKAYKSFQDLSDEQKESAYAGAMKYVLRRSRLEHPEGSWDSDGCFFPSAYENAGWIEENISSPTKRYPYSYMLACRTVEHCCRLTNTPVEHARWVITLEQLAYGSQLHSYKRFLVRIKAMCKVAEKKAKQKLVRYTRINADHIDKCEVVRSELRSDLKTYGKRQEWTAPWEVVKFFYENYTSEEYREDNPNFSDLLSSFERMRDTEHRTRWINLSQAVDLLADYFDDHACDDFLKECGAIERYTKSALRAANRRPKMDFIKKVAPSPKKV
ncbi:hypothetical protein [Stenotrophomonas maltophilia]|uniref:hypothetical protein n=1 Tax=Stenotrophomonas maltophilia TaxID=40324 RepID=UPI0011B1F1DF|nr:hypothetical protein [Stenotrophomonas maltophilia]